MGRKRKCKNFAWRDEDDAWKFERNNDKTVFRKIRRETSRGRSVGKVIAMLCDHDFWSGRMSGKAPKSWKERYFQWRKRCRI